MIHTEREAEVMGTPLVIAEKKDRIVTLTLNNPDRRNAIGVEMVDELFTAVEEIKGDSEVSAVVLTGAGKGFSSGGDVTSMAQPPGIGEDEAVGFLKNFYLKSLSVMEIPVPTIAAVNGHAIGAGCMLALACDMRIVSAEAKLGLGFVKIGLHPGMGTSFFLPRLVGKARAYELLLTGEPVTGEEAVRIGLVNRAVEPERVMDEALELAGKIARGPAVPIRRMKYSIGGTYDRDLAETLDLEARIQVECFKTEDLKEGITAFLEKREPYFKGR
jgi:enoyl-CoA hydratase/carnithine racemase